MAQKSSSTAKAKPKAPRKNSVLTDKQNTYVEARLDGKSKTEAAKLAGYSGDNFTVEQSDDVKKALMNARSELSSATQIKRADVIEMFQEAYHLAKLGGEPSSMVSAAKEIGKMLGLYEPESIKVELTRNQGSIQKKLLTMSDAELLDMANGKGEVIEGEFVRVQ